MAQMATHRLAGLRDGIVLLHTDGARYSRASLDIVAELAASGREGLVITANRPYHVLRAALAEAGVAGRVRYLDCVSGLTGLAPPPDPDATFVESPTLLEKILLRTEQLLRRMPAPRFLVLDSLSTLAVYNGTPAVVELAHTLVNRLRHLETLAILVLVEKQAGEELSDAVTPLCDTVLR